MAAAKKSAKDVLGGLNLNIVVVAGWVVGVVAVLAIYYFVFYEPLSEERTAEEAHKVALVQDRTTAENNLRRYNTDVAELARARQRAQQLQAVLPNDPDIPGFMRNVNALAEASGLQISLILPVEERVEQYFARIPVQLTVRGTYLSLARFFHSVSQLPRVINMENIRLGTPTEDPVSHEVKLEAQVLATTFRGVSRTAGAAGAAGAGAAGAAGAAAPRGGTP
ncbi:MAG: type 4a pilus biogenesis protein PilO [Polyangiales bacterium]